MPIFLFPELIRQGRRIIGIETSTGHEQASWGVGAGRGERMGRDDVAVAGQRRGDREVGVGTGEAPAACVVTRVSADGMGREPA